jgi:formamidopyrimidine-DNA glycosylase
MPELPEVETIRKQLSEVLVGQTIKEIEVRKEKSFVGEVGEMLGKRIVSIQRKGKMLMVELTGKVFLLVHLKMTGQLIYQEKDVSSGSPLHPSNGALPNPPLTGEGTTQYHRIVGGHPTKDWVQDLPSSHTRAILKLDKGTVFFNDQRIFGWLKVADSKLVNQLVSKMPPDIIDKEMDERKFWEVISKSGRPIKVVVMDSSKLGGVGNIYANDGLYEAGISPFRKARELTRKESDRLLKSLKDRVNLGIKLGGATASDEKFVQVSGLGGRYQEHFLTYEQEGKKCGRCGGVIKKERLGGRGTYWCEGCQV